MTGEKEKFSYPDYINRGKLEQSLSENQLYALEKKYLGRDDDGNVTETPGEAIYRIAKTMAEVEMRYGADDKQIEKFTKEFYSIISDCYFSPAGRIWTNAGTEIKSLFNCYVLPVHDSMERDEPGSIFNSLADASVIHKNGGGTGYNFSELRPRGTFVKKARGIASGPVSFIGQFDKETEVINSGNRRGANMGILEVNHPDILDFIYAKTLKGKITNFNVSVGITNNFMKAVENDESYNLEFPSGAPFSYLSLKSIIKNVEENKIGGAEVGGLPEPASLNFDSKDIVPGKTKIIDSQYGEAAGIIDEEGIIKLSAKYVFNKIAELAWKTGDPGIVFLDEINKYNSLPKLGPIKATNPCGEQPLHPNDACNLGSIILSNMIKEKKDGSKEIDYNKLKKTISTAVRFMDNVNDVNRGPLRQIEKTVLSHRRIGLGVMGFADMLIELGVPYDSEKARIVAEEVMSFISDEAKKSSVELASEKGVFPAFEESKYNNGKLEDKVRNLERTTIAPTGTISMIYDVSSGIEPLFAITYRKKIRGGDTLQYTNPKFVEECKKRGINIEKIIPLIEKNNGSVFGISEIPEDMQKIFKVSYDLDFESQIGMQSAFQKHTDNAVSKTLNLKNNASIDDIKKAYFLAWKSGLKGITVYRDGSKSVQVLNAGHEDKKEGSMENPLKLSGIMPALRIRQVTPFGNMHVTLVLDPLKDYAPVETFGTIGNAGGIESATMEGIGRMSSLWLRSGGKLEKIIDQLEGIGSGMSSLSRDGGVQSLEMGFAQALKKYELARQKHAIEDILSGKIDLDNFENEISDILRKSTPNDFKEIKGENKKTYRQKCPSLGCSGFISYEEGCKQCHTCGYSKC